ncbi:hypothetical protein B0T25DRAFT_541032 [Lasiosphaeria hispida]|uniref:Uncharacterized protein n=1 Tax=Lasiosphaeria hispida TaxID=260671 RepID=A0AAJ0HNJ6_9PEZI|nr:hypothetical protein B0T25DRAFT_541032 [Lasiosphaeria hispida]
MPSSRAAARCWTTFHIAAVLASCSCLRLDKNLDMCLVVWPCLGAMVKACAGCAWVVRVWEGGLKAKEGVVFL